MHHHHYHMYITNCSHTSKFSSLAISVTSAFYPCHVYCCQKLLSSYWCCKSHQRLLQSTCWTSITVIKRDCHLSSLLVIFKSRILQQMLILLSQSNCASEGCQLSLVSQGNLVIKPSHKLSFDFLQSLLQTTSTKVVTVQFNLFNVHYSTAHNIVLKWCFNK